jgi:hypothetical protein
VFTRTRSSLWLFHSESLTKTLHAFCCICGSGYENCVMVFCIPWAFYIFFRRCGPARQPAHRLKRCVVSPPTHVRTGPRLTGVGGWTVERRTTVERLELTEGLHEYCGSTPSRGYLKFPPTSSSIYCIILVMYTVSSNSLLSFFNLIPPYIESAYRSVSLSVLEILGHIGVGCVGGYEQQYQHVDVTCV